MARWPVRGISARAGDWRGLAFAARSSARDIGLRSFRAVVELKPPQMGLPERDGSGHRARRCAVGLAKLYHLQRRRGVGPVRM